MSGQLIIKFCRPRGIGQHYNVLSAEMCRVSIIKFSRPGGVGSADYKVL